MRTIDPAAWPVERHPPLETLATGQPHRDVVKGVMRPDGSRVWISVSTALVDLPAPYAGHGVVGSFVAPNLTIAAAGILGTTITLLIARQALTTEQRQPVPQSAP